MLPLLVAMAMPLRGMAAARRRGRPPARRRSRRAAAAAVEGWWWLMLRWRPALPALRWSSAGPPSSVMGLARLLSGLKGVIR